MKFRKTNNPSTEFELTKNFSKGVLPLHTKNNDIYPLYISSKIDGGNVTISVPEEKAFTT